MTVANAVLLQKTPRVTAGCQCTLPQLNQFRCAAETNRLNSNCPGLAGLWWTGHRKVATEVHETRRVIHRLQNTDGPIAEFEFDLKSYA